MKKVSLKSIAAIAASVCLLASCSTTKVLSEGEYRLASNSITIDSDEPLKARELEPYINQKPNSSIVLGWSPFLYIYNWNASHPESGAARFFRNIGEAPVIYDPDQVSRSIEAIGSHLEYLGYYNSKVDSRISLNRKNVSVEYVVTPGKRHRIDEVRFSVPERGDFKDDFYADTVNVTVHPGDYLAEALLESESERGAAHFRRMGYYGFSKNYYFFEADTVTTPGKLILEMAVREYTRNETEASARPIRKFTLDTVTISHPTSLRFNEKILRDLNTIKPGSLYDESDINTTYNRLSALKVFNSVSIGMTEKADDKVDCAINLTQSQMQGFKVNFEASTNSSGLMGLSPQLSFFHKNIFSGGEWLNLSFMGNFQFKFNDPTRSDELGISAGLSFPRFLGLPYSLFKGSDIPRTDINLSYNFQHRPEYTRNIFSSSFGYSGRLNPNTAYQLYPLQFNMVKLFDMDPEFNKILERNPFMRYTYQDHFDIGIGGVLQYSSSLEPNPSVSFNYFRLAVDFSGNALSMFKGLMNTDSEGRGMILGAPFSQYLRGELSLGRTWRFGEDNGQALATRLLAGAGYAYGNSSALPFEKQFYSGGANSMRGWQARALGPGSATPDLTFSIPSQTGDIKLEANVEYRFNLFWKLAGALFLDAGNVWTAREFDGFSKSIAADWGTGLRVDLSFLVLRIDMGMKMYDPSRESSWLTPGEWLDKDGYAIHFGVGYPF